MLPFCILCASLFARIFVASSSSKEEEKLKSPKVSSFIDLKADFPDFKDFMNDVRKLEELAVKENDHLIHEDYIRLFIKGCINGFVENVDKALQKHPSIIDQGFMEYKGLTGLMLASAFGRTEVLKYLLRQKADARRIVELSLESVADVWGASRSEGKRSGFLTAMHFAVAENRIEAVHLLADHDPSLLNVGKDHFPLAHLAFSSSEEIRMLLEKLDGTGRTDPHQRPFPEIDWMHGRGLMDRFLPSEDLETCTQVKDKHLDVAKPKSLLDVANIMASEYVPALRQAALNAELGPAVSLLLDSKSATLAKDDAMPEYPLPTITSKGAKLDLLHSTVKSLLESKASPFYQAEGGFDFKALPRLKAIEIHKISLLCETKRQRVSNPKKVKRACRLGNLERCTHLLSRYPDLTILGLEAAIQGGRSGLLKHLLKNVPLDIKTNFEKLLLLAIRSNWSDCAEALLSASGIAEGIKLDSVHKEAIANDNWMVLKLLFDKGLDPPTKDKLCAMIIEHSASNVLRWTVETKMVLLEDLGDKKTGETALHKVCAMKRGFKRGLFVEMLVRLGLDPRVKSKITAATALHYAAVNLNCLAIETICRHSPELLPDLINAKDFAGRTPLHLVAHHESHARPLGLAMLRSLVDLGGDPLVRDNAGMTALSLLTENVSIGYIVTRLVLNAFKLTFWDKASLHDPVPTLRKLFQHQLVPACTALEYTATIGMLAWAFSSLTTSEESACPICFENECDSFSWPCFHFFCRPCLEEWMDVASSAFQCPICKTSVQ